MINMKKKKNIITIIIITIIILLVAVLFIVNPFNLLKLKGSVEIGNKAFTDQFFYSDIVYNYYSNLYQDEDDEMAMFNTFYDSYEAGISDIYFLIESKYNNLYKMSLSDSQLSTISELYLDNYFITNLKGIEKLNNLTTLSGNINVTELDLSNNSKISHVNINSDDFIKDILLPNNNVLKSSIINCSKYELRSPNNTFNINDKNFDASGIKSINFNNLEVKIYSDDKLTNEITDNLIASDLLGKYLVLRADDTEFKYQITYTENSENDNAVTSDSFLYSKIIEEYNKENNTNYDTNYSLSKQEASKLKKLEITCSNNKIDSLEKLEYYKGLQTLKINNCGLTDFTDYSLRNLKELDLSNNDITEFSIFDSAFLEKLNLSNNPNLEIIGASSFLLKEININNDNSIYIIQVLSPMLTKMDGIENLDLQILLLVYSKLEKLDITKMKNLPMVSFVNSDFTKNKVNILVGQNKELEYKLKMPDSYYDKDIYNEDDYIATIKDNVITAHNIGETVFTKYYNALDFSIMGYYDDDEQTLFPIKTYVNVYDIKSSKFLVNKEHNYIYTKQETDDKVIKRYIKVYGDNAKKTYDANKKKISLESNDEKLFTFDIVSIDSDDYQIKNNVIKYTEEFDINKLKITNATASVIDNQLQLICNGAIVDTFILEERN